jgi:hypothetical protein
MRRLFSIFEFVLLTLAAYQDKVPDTFRKPASEAVDHVDTCAGFLSCDAHELIPCLL